MAWYDSVGKWVSWPLAITDELVDAFDGEGDGIYNDSTGKFGISSGKKKTPFNSDINGYQQQLAQQLRENPNEMPGPQVPGRQQMQPFNYEAGQNPFAAAANRAGFSDFPTAPTPMTPSSPPTLTPTSPIGGSIAGNISDSLQRLPGPIGQGLARWAQTGQGAQGPIGRAMTSGAQPQLVNRGSLGNQSAQASALRGGANNG